MPAVKMMQSWQRSRIFGRCRELGMTTKSDDKSDDLHLLIGSRAGKDSLTRLTFDEANGVIGELEHRQRFSDTPDPPSKKFAFTHVPGKMTYDQYRKVLALMCELRKCDPAPINATIEQRVAGIVRKYMHMTVSKDNPYSWLSVYKGKQLIECIKGILDTAREQASERSETG